MNISVLSIGDELLKGATINTNFANLGQILLRSGMMIEKEMCVKDVYEAIIDACEFLSKSENIIITTGGLGPTADDITKTTISEWTNRKLIKSSEVEKRILDFYKKTGRKMSSEKVLTQTFVPEGAKILENENGTAPGLIIPANKTKCRYIIMLPGPPREAIPMFERQVIPFLEEINEKKIYSDYFVVAGIPESKVELMLKPITEKFGVDVRFAFCASPGKVKVFFLAESGRVIGEAVEQAKRIFGENLLIHGIDIAEELSCLLKQKKLSLATAESCTGGLISEKLTAISGASELFIGGVIAYNNRIKTDVLGVSPRTITKYGAVSRECVSEMVCGVCEKFNTDTGIAVTGIAGPSGGTDEKPVGTVYIGTSYGRDIKVTHNIFRGDRNSIRERAAQTALNQLRLMLL